MPSTPSSAPSRIDRSRALGWRDVSIDGLNCYLRYAEAMLQERGYTADDVVQELGGAITDRFESDGSPYLGFSAVSARWYVAPPGSSSWDRLAAAVEEGKALLVWPDAYFWPGDEFEGVRHVHHHSFLALRLDRDRLHYLDVESDERRGYRMDIRVTDDVRRACTRVLELHIPPPPRAIDEAAVRDLLVRSLSPLANLADQTSELAEAWVEIVSRPLARAVDLWAISDVQPQPYLLAHMCERIGFADVAACARRAAAQAKKISLFLYGLHRYEADAPYYLCESDLAELGSRLAALAAEMSDVVSVAVPPPDRTRRTSLRQRLDAISRWHEFVRLDWPAPVSSPGAPLLTRGRRRPSRS